MTPQCYALISLWPAGRVAATARTGRAALNTLRHAPLLGRVSHFRSFTTGSGTLARSSR
jgi:hypothetical protein